MQCQIFLGFVNPSAQPWSWPGNSKGKTGGEGMSMEMKSRKDPNLKKTVRDLLDTLKKLMRAFPAEDGGRFLTKKS